mgnify:CR=1 FL=1
MKSLLRLILLITLLPAVAAAQPHAASAVEIIVFNAPAPEASGTGVY